MNISKFVNNPGKPFHTSGYARAANGDCMGATSAESFNQRTNVEKNRKAIREYRVSMVAQGSVRSTVGPQVSPLSRMNLRVGSRKQLDARRPDSVPQVGQQKPTFQEPTTRSYNPFG